MAKTKILIAIDDPDWACIIAHTLFNLINKETSEIILLNVLETTVAEEEVFYASPEGFIKTEARKANFAYVENFLEKNGFKYEFIFKEGDVAKRIIETAKEFDIDVIALGSHNKKILEKLFLGSVAYKVSRGCKRSVLIISNKVQAHEARNEFKVLLAVDGSEPAYYAAQTFHELIDAKRANVDILNATVPPQNVIPPEAYIYTDIEKIKEEARKVSEDILEIAAQKLEGQEVKQINKVSVCGHISGSIIEYAEKNAIDLIVMGEHGKKNLSERILGSISAKVSEKSQIPLLLIKKK